MIRADDPTSLSQFKGVLCYVGGCLRSCVLSLWKSRTLYRLAACVAWCSTRLILFGYRFVAFGACVVSFAVILLLKRLATFVIRIASFGACLASFVARATAVSTRTTTLLARTVALVILVLVTAVTGFVARLASCVTRFLALATASVVSSLVWLGSCLVSFATSAASISRVLCRCLFRLLVKAWVTWQANKASTSSAQRANTIHRMADGFRQGHYRTSSNFGSLRHSASSSCLQQARSDSSRSFGIPKSPSCPAFFELRDTPLVEPVARAPIELPPLLATPQDIARLGVTPEPSSLSGGLTRSPAMWSIPAGSIKGNSPSDVDTDSDDSRKSTKGSGYFSRVYEMVSGAGGEPAEDSTQQAITSTPGIREVFRRSLDSIKANRRSSTSSSGSEAASNSSRRSASGSERSASGGDSSYPREESAEYVSSGDEAVHAERARERPRVGTLLPGHGRNNHVGYGRQRAVTESPPGELDSARENLPAAREVHRWAEDDSVALEDSAEEDSTEYLAEDSAEDLAEYSPRRFSGNSSRNSARNSANVSRRTVQGNLTGKDVSLSDMDIETPLKGNESVVDKDNVSSPVGGDGSNMSIDGQPSFSNQPRQSPLTTMGSREWLSGIGRILFAKPSAQGRISADSSQQPVMPLKENFVDAHRNPFLDTGDRPKALAEVQLGQSIGGRDVEPERRFEVS